MRSVHNVADHGAVGDGKKDCTKAIAEAIDACAGGGRVLLPPGEYLTGPIILKSNIELHVQAGATVIFTCDYKAYPLIETHYEGLRRVRCTSPIHGRNLRNVAITGAGIFDGAGQAWRPVKKFKMSQQQWADLLASGGVTDQAGQIWWPTEQARDGAAYLEKLRKSGRQPAIEEYEPAREYLRPCLLELVECRDVVLEGCTFRNSPAWNLHPLLCDGVTVRNVTVLNPWWSQNGDGLDLDSCRDCLVEGSHFDVGDDAICIKSGRDEEGRRLGRPSEKIIIRNCTVAHGHGGVVIGSEMSGGVRNVEVSNCVFDGTDVGLRFKTTRGRGGVVENVRISNVVMSNIREEAILFDMYYAVRSADQKPPASRGGEPSLASTEGFPDPGTPIFRNFRIANITCRGVPKPGVSGLGSPSAGTAINIRGLPEMPVEAVTIENAVISANVGVSLSHARDITLIGVQVQARQQPVLQCSNVRNLVLDRFVATVTV